MRHNFYFGISCLLLLYLPSCTVEDKCWGAPCADNINFQLIDKTTQQDIVFGINPKYKIDSMQLNLKADFRIGIHENGLATVTGDYRGLQTSTGKRPLDTAYLRLTYIDIDTLVISYTHEPKNCCKALGGYGKIISIKYNGQLAQKTGDYFKFEKL